MDASETRKRGLIILATIIGASILAGALTLMLGSQSEPRRIADRPSGTTAAASEPWARDAAFLLALDGEGIPYTSEQGVIDLAQFICKDLRDNPHRTRSDVGLLIMNTSIYGAKEAGFLAGAAVNTYCPEFNTR